MNKKIGWGIIAIAMIVIAFYFFLSRTQEKSNPGYVIGCSAPLTGDGANYGRSVKEGVDLATEEINREDFLNNPLKVIFEDDRMNPNDGVNAINKLILTDKVPVIIGPFGSSIVMATAPIADKNGTVIISASATADAIKDAGDYIFRITPPIIIFPLYPEFLNKRMNSNVDKS